MDRARLANDAVWRDIALSARNAVLLASPVALPAGQRFSETTLTLRLDPRDTLHQGSSQATRNPASVE